MTTFLSEIYQQPQALREQIQFYEQSEMQQRLASLPVPTVPLLTGMGASYHAALIAQLHAHTLKIPAQVIEAADLLNYSSPILPAVSQLVFVSQSGSSGEIAPIIQQLPEDAALLAVTNDEQSLLARQAQVVLPLMAGAEATVATKTYLNSLATLWLMVRRWGRENSGRVNSSSEDSGRESAMLAAITDECERLLEKADTQLSRWLDVADSSSHFLFVGHGPHAATAHQAAQTVTEWAKIPVQSYSIGAFRHGRIENAGPKLGAVIFAGMGAAHASACALAKELEEYGANVLIVENGRTRALSEPANESQFDDEFLTPMLDILPAQIFAEGLAQHLGVALGFRHISKVVTRL